MNGDLLLRKFITLCVYLAYFLFLFWVMSAWERPELIVLSVLSIAVVFAVGDKRPGTIIVLMILLTAVYLGEAYTADNVVYSLHYAKVAVVSLLSTLIIPAYLIMSATSRLTEAIIGGSYVAAFVMSVAGLRSIATSFSLFASLSTVTTRNYVLAIAMSISYSIFYLTTTYVAKFSTVDLSKLVAVPVEFSTIEKEYLGDWALIRLFISLALFALGLLLSVFVEERVRKTRFSALEGKIMRAFALELAAKMAIAISITVLATLLSSSLVNVPTTTLVMVAIIGTLNFARNYIDLTEEIRGLIAECHERAESLRRKIEISNDILGRLQGSTLTSLEDLKKSYSEATNVLSSCENIKRPGVTGFSTISKIRRKLEEADRELNNKLLNVISELSSNIKTLLGASTPELRESLAFILTELETIRQEPGKMGVLPDLLLKIIQSLERWCYELRRMLSETIPRFYRDVLGIEFSIREIPECSGNNFRDLLTYQDYVLAALLGIDRQVDSLVDKLDKLSSEARRLSKVLEAYGLKGHHQLLKLLEVYWECFSQAHLLASLELPKKILPMLEMREAIISRISTLLGGFHIADTRDSHINQTISEFMKPLEESLRELTSHELPFLDLILILENILKNLSSAAWTFSGIYTLIESLRLLRSIQPLISDYIRDGIKHGYKFEDIFPLREDLRRLWILIYGSGD